MDELRMIIDIRKFGHWGVPFDFTEEAHWVGFIYLITHIPTGRKYIGRKQLIKQRSKTVKCKTKPGTKRRIYKSVSTWRTYTGSSKELNMDIQKYGKEQFQFTILSLHDTKSSLAYEETKQLILREALTKTQDGIKVYYNKCIPAVRVPPKYLHTKTDKVGVAVLTLNK